MSFLAAEIIEEAADKTEYKWNSIFNKSKNKKRRSFNRYFSI